MIPYHEMPEDNRDLAYLKVSFPYLPGNSSDSCPVKMDDILDYLQVEATPEQLIQARDLTFLRTALVEKERFWIWQFIDSDGQKCYVTASQPPHEPPCISFDADYYGLTPEQFILGTYYQVF